MKNSTLRNDIVQVAQKSAGIEAKRNGLVFSEAIRSVYHTIDRLISGSLMITIDRQYKESRFDALERLKVLPHYLFMLDSYLDSLETSFLDMNLQETNNFSMNLFDYTSKDVTEENFHIGAVEGVYANYKNDCIVVIKNDTVMQYDKIDKRTSVSTKEELLNELSNVNLKDLIKHIHLDSLNIKFKVQ